MAAVLPRSGVMASTTLQTSDTKRVVSFSFQPSIQRILRASARMNPCFRCCAAFIYFYKAEGTRAVGWRAAGRRGAGEDAFGWVAVVSSTRI